MRCKNAQAKLDSSERGLKVKRTSPTTKVAKLELPTRIPLRPSPKKPSSPSTEHKMTCQREIAHNKALGRDSAPAAAAVTAATTPRRSPLTPVKPVARMLKKSPDPKSTNAERPAVRATMTKYSAKAGGGGGGGGTKEKAAQKSPMRSPTVPLKGSTPLPRPKGLLRQQTAVVGEEEPPYSPLKLLTPPKPPPIDVSPLFKPSGSESSIKAKELEVTPRNLRLEEPFWLKESSVVNYSSFNFITAVKKKLQSATFEPIKREMTPPRPTVVPSKGPEVVVKTPREKEEATEEDTVSEVPSIRSESFNSALSEPMMPPEPPNKPLDRSDSRDEELQSMLANFKRRLSDLEELRTKLSSPSDKTINKDLLSVRTDTQSDDFVKEEVVSATYSDTFEASDDAKSSEISEMISVKRQSSSSLLVQRVDQLLLKHQRHFSPEETHMMKKLGGAKLLAILALYAKYVIDHLRNNIAQLERKKRRCRRKSGASALKKQQRATLMDLERRLRKRAAKRASASYAESETDAKSDTLVSESQQEEEEKEEETKTLSLDPLDPPTVEEAATKEPETPPDDPETEPLPSYSEKFDSYEENSTPKPDKSDHSEVENNEDGDSGTSSHNTSVETSVQLPSPPPISPPKLQDPTSKDYKLPDIISEAEALRLQQLQIEQEIEQLQQQVSFVFFRNVPSKPPPPYTPSPREAQNAYHLPNPSEIRLTTVQRVHELFTNTSTDPQPSDLNARLIADASTELFTQTIAEDDIEPPLVAMKVFRTITDPERRLNFLRDNIGRTMDKLWRGLALMHDLATQNQFLYSNRRKRDAVDNLLVLEVLREDPEWAGMCFERAKSEAVDFVLDAMLDEALDEMEATYVAKNGVP